MPDRGPDRRDRRKSLPARRQNRASQPTSFTKTQKGSAKVANFFERRKPVEERRLRTTRRQAKVRTKLKTENKQKIYNYEIDEEFRCTAALEKGNEQREGRYGAFLLHMGKWKFQLLYKGTNCSNRNTRRNNKNVLCPCMINLHPPVDNNRRMQKITIP